MEKAYESLCLELDHLLIEILRFGQKHIESELEIEKLMNEGYFYLAKARYINGSATVSMMQLPTEFSKPMEPLATVVKEEKDGEISWKVVRRTSEGRHSVDTSDDGVRQRRGKSDDLNMDVVEKPLPDPIKYFGVLVPQALKDAQQCFIKAVDATVVSADVHSKLMGYMERYSTLMKKKVLLTAKQHRES